MNTPEPIDINQMAVMIIANAGDSRSASMEAIEAARSGDIEKAEQLLIDSASALKRSQEAHALLLVNEARNNDLKINMMLVHASNHYSIAELTKDLSEQFINLYKEIKHGN